ncbi:5'(3')-deoxyribonucleotidase [Staphylococcus sp. SQ8-PEA]|uniref:Putative 5'(3')-deoxyribonucleotidase n=1 Tax=Staphylococcus marylandisciuri TaxID=2981529 RepID=A0ABT2QPA9_9STAP|nr:5'(3')-deoxyribonucleotidase [Staphylococcus marylandisciuri]MCU5745813.1 5'(3')-deoxyribonucleotidase [Staphylococcus marylandisciuri]
MTRQSIAIDMDEVLADTLGAMMREVNERYDLGITYGMLDGQKLKHVIPEHDGLLPEILRQPGFFKNLDVMQDAIDVVEALNQHYDIYIATAAMDVPTSFSEKYDWLRTYFSFLDPQHFVFCGRKNIVKADFLIDDNPRQLEIFEGKPIMFSAPHNVHETRFTRVSGWKDVANYFLKSEHNVSES